MEQFVSLFTRMVVALETIAKNFGSVPAASAADTETKATAGKATKTTATKATKPAVTLEDAKAALAALKEHIDGAGDKGIVNVRKVLNEQAGVEKSAELPDDPAVFAKVVKGAEAELAAYKKAQEEAGEEV